MRCLDYRKRGGTGAETRGEKYEEEKDASLNLCQIEEEEKRELL